MFFFFSIIIRLTMCALWVGVQTGSLSVLQFAHVADLSFEEMIIIPGHGARRALCHPRSARYFLRNVSEATLVAELTTSLAFSAKLLIFSLAASRSISSILSFILSFVLTILSEAEALTPFAARSPADRKSVV